MNGEQAGATLRREARRDSQLVLGNDKLERLETRAPTTPTTRLFGIIGWDSRTVTLFRAACRRSMAFRDISFWQA
jgi:hypothetical protein